MKHIINTRFSNILLLSTILLLSCSKSFAQSSLTFKQPWIAEAPPVSKVLAAYMEITNNTDKTIVITAISSEDFSRIEFHRTIHENDIAKMQHQESLSRPAHGSLKLEQGSYHLMLFNPARALRAGSSSIFRVTTENNQQHEISVAVKKSNTDQIDHSHHHH